MNRIGRRSKNPAPVCSRALALRMLKDTVGHGIVGDIKIVRITPDENGRLGTGLTNVTCGNTLFAASPSGTFNAGDSFYSLSPQERSGTFSALSPARRVQVRLERFNRRRRVTGYFARAGDRRRPAVVALIGKAMYCSALA